MAFSPIIESFSLSHAEVLDGSTTFLDAYAATAGQDYDIYGVNEASLEPDTDEFENEGDDVVLSSWAWLNFAELEVQGGYMSFPLIAKLTGQTVSSGTVSTKQVYGLDLWHEDAMNVAPKPVIVRMPAKDHLGVAGNFVIGLYKVQFKPITFEGPAYKDGLKVNYSGKALYSAADEVGAAFADGKKRVGRLLAIER